MSDTIRLRNIKESDLQGFFEHQRDPAAFEMAAFTPRNYEAFMVHWRAILANDSVITRTILFNDAVAGNVVCYEQSGRNLIGYWIGQQFWRRGIATRAVSEFVAIVDRRPLFAYVATTNVASKRVLEKCGFRLRTEDQAAGNSNNNQVEELTYVLTD